MLAKRDSIGKIDAKNVDRCFPNRRPRGYIWSIPAEVFSPPVNPRIEKWTDLIRVGIPQRRIALGIAATDCLDT